MRSSGGILILVAGLGIAGCKPAPPPPPEPTPTPSVTPIPTPPPPPTPTPTPRIPRKPLDAAQLFSGILFRPRLQAPQSDRLASTERKDPESYVAQITVTVQKPRAARSVDDFKSNDPELAAILARIPGFPEEAKVSPAFDRIYELKAQWNRDRLEKLDQLVSRHNFYDCETILEFDGGTGGRKFLLLKGDMDVNVDGSDGDRNVEVDGSSRFFQPQTSHRWKKRTDRPNPFLAPAEERLEELRAEFAIPGLPAERNAELRQGIEFWSRRVYDLKTWSFLISSSDPSIVLPGFMLRKDEDSGPYAAFGDYAVVIYGGVGYPAIVGDAGPSYKFGEASLRLCKALNERSSALSRPVSEINVAYLVFPESADQPGPPDLDHWHARCKELLEEIGLGDLTLHRWENTVPPWPTPTPTPTPTPEAATDPAATPDAGAPSMAPSPTAPTESTPTPAG